jgi:hypothetical protein
VEEIAHGASAERRVVVMTDYLIDELSWNVEGTRLFSLPVHLDGECDELTWTSAPLDGAGGLEDGVDFVHDAERTVPESWPVRLHAKHGTAQADVWLSAPAGTVLWRARAPGPPGKTKRRFHLLESADSRGTFTTVIAWRSSVRDVLVRVAGVVVELNDGGTHEHAARAKSWRVDLKAAGARSSIDLEGFVGKSSRGAAVASAKTRDVDEASAVQPDDQRQYLRFERDASGHSGKLLVHLGESDYRRSEQKWAEAGAPTAELALWADRGGLHVSVESRTGAPVTLADGVENDMDNENADVNVSGVQLHLRDARGAYAGWLVRPSPGASGEAAHATLSSMADARVRSLAHGVPLIDARWALTPDGWMIEATIPYALLGDASPYSVELGIVVNEIPPGRERRRGQLVLGGAEGEWVYLRGDRHDPARMLPILID